MKVLKYLFEVSLYFLGKYRVNGSNGWVNMFCGIALVVFFDLKNIYLIE